MNYRKISPNQGGLKGAEIHYFEENDKGLLELRKYYPRNPMHIGLQKLFKDLRIHLLKASDSLDLEIDDPRALSKCLETTVTNLEIHGDSIFLSGKKNIGDKETPRATYLIQEEDGYEFWDDLNTIVDKIKEETTEYLNGTKKVPDAEIIAMWAQANHKEEEFTMEKLLSLPPDQLEKMAIKIIEKGRGGIVMMPEDMSDSSESMTETIEELKTEFEISSDATVIPIGEAPKKSRKKKEDSKVLVTDQNGNMSVSAPAEPIQSDEDF